MVMYKVYKWDCIVRWILLGLAAFVWFFFGTNSFPTPLSGLPLLLYIIPVHPVLWLISIIVSIKNKKIPSIVFNCIAPVISIAFLFLLIIIHVDVTGGV